LSFVCPVRSYCGSVQGLIGRCADPSTSPGSRSGPNLDLDRRGHGTWGRSSVYSFIHSRCQSRRVACILCRLDIASLPDIARVLFIPSHLFPTRSSAQILILISFFPMYRKASKSPMAKEGACRWTRWTRRRRFRFVLFFSFMSWLLARRRRSSIHLSICVSASPSCSCSPTTLLYRLVLVLRSAALRPPACFPFALLLFPMTTPHSYIHSPTLPTYVQALRTSYPHSP
jgi:hypothetical protein